MADAEFAIVNARKRKRKPCAMLRYSDTDGFTIELADDATVANVPAMFIPFVEKGERTINSKWATRWVETRICPPSRQNIGEVLKAHGLEEYDALTLLRSSQGLSSHDDFLAIEVTDDASIDRDALHAKFRKRVGSAIRAKRRELGLSQSDLAYEIGIAQGSVSHIESGKANITLDMLVDVCQALDVEPGAMLNGAN